MNKQAAKKVNNITIDVDLKNKIEFQKAMAQLDALQEEFKLSDSNYAKELIQQEKELQMVELDLDIEKEYRELENEFLSDDDHKENHKKKTDKFKNESVQKEYESTVFSYIEEENW